MRTQTATQAGEFIAAMLHYGPGPHPDGTPQAVHGGGGGQQGLPDKNADLGSGSQGARQGLQEANTFADSLKSKDARRFAEGLIAYYREYGTHRQVGWPSSGNLPRSTINRISNTVRSLMVGDVDARGNAINAAGKHV
jgi:hypothetical protein